MRSIQLNRANKLNALNGSMIRKILPRLQEYEKSQLASVIIIKGSGERSFCAGGDVATLAKQNSTPEGIKASTEFFHEEYKLDHLIATYSKPYVAFMDGITMGGGVGLSVHAPFRIATERTVFAMPETTIGFFPDVGGSFFLSRLDGEVGTYLALTSERLKGIHTLHAGIASHYIHSSSLPDLEARLSELRFNDNSTLVERNLIVDTTIEEFVTEFPQEQFQLTGSLREAIDRNFRFTTVDEILHSLESETVHPEWAKKTIATIRERSPISVRVALRQLREGKNWNITETFQREFFMAARFMEKPDFVEGVTALLIEKNRKPTWSTTFEATSEWPAKPAAETTEPTAEPTAETESPVESAEFTDSTSALDFTETPAGPVRVTDEYFAITAEAEKLEVLQRGQNWTQYPRKNIGLPSEREIRREIEDASWTERDLLLYLEDSYRGKQGLRAKFYDVVARKTRKGVDGRLVWREL